MPRQAAPGPQRPGQGRSVLCPWPRGRRYRKKSLIVSPVSIPPEVRPALRRNLPTRRQRCFELCRRVGFDPPWRIRRSVPIQARIASCPFPVSRAANRRAVDGHDPALRRVMISAKPSIVAVEKGITLPKGYQAAKDLNLVDLNPGGQRARRHDNDDVACFVNYDPEQEAGRNLFTTLACLVMRSLQGRKHFGIGSGMRSSR
jgi:hypothetical protein